MLSVDFLARIGNFELQVTFHAEREIVAVVGPSGAGKSLTLQCLAGLFRPLSGAISLNGRLFFDSEKRVHVPARQRRIGYVVQSYALFPHLGVAQNLAFGLAGLPRDAVRRRVADLVDMLGLVGFEERPAPTSYPAASSSGSRSGERWLSSRSCFCWTSPSRLWIRSPRPA